MAENLNIGERHKLTDSKNSAKFQSDHQINLHEDMS